MKGGGRLPFDEADGPGGEPAGSRINGGGGATPSPDAPLSGSTSPDSPADASPEALLAAARSVLSSRGVADSLWPKAVALLARQALECALDDFWRRHAPGVQYCSVRAQLLCLPSYLRADDGGRARDITTAWSGLSHACHHHPYELPATAEELGLWLQVVESLCERA